MRSALPFLLAAALLGPGPAAAEVVLAVYGGIQGVEGSRLDGAAGSRDVDWAGESLSAPPYWGARATFWQDAWGLAVEINHAKAAAGNRRAAGYETLEFTDGLNLATVSAMRRWSAPDRDWSPYLGAGLGVAVPHVEITPIGGESTSEYQVSGPVLQLVAGTSWGLNRRWEVFGEWKGTWSKHRFDVDGGRSLETEFVTNALNLGIGYRF